jgi:hypothetical protein
MDSSVANQKLNFVRVPILDVQKLLPVKGMAIRLNGLVYEVKFINSKTGEIRLGLLGVDTSIKMEPKEEETMEQTSNETK